MSTVYVSIGNSDDKLTQADWAKYVGDFHEVMAELATRIYGVWLSEPSSEYQNACIAAEINPADIEVCKDELTTLRQGFRQDSIAWAVAPETEFI